MTSHYSDWFIGIIDPLHTANNQGFGHCSNVPVNKTGEKKKNDFHVSSQKAASGSFEHQVGDI